MENKKIGGKIRITNEMMAKVLGLPGGVRIESAQQDVARDILIFKIKSNEPIEGLTKETGESQEYQDVQDAHLLFLKQAMRTAKNLMRNDPKLYADIEKDIAKEE